MRLSSKPPSQSLPLKGWVLGVLEEKGSCSLSATLRVLEKPNRETHRCLILSLVRGEKTSRSSASGHWPCWWVGGRLTYQRSEHRARLPVPQSTHSRSVIDLEDRQEDECIETVVFRLEFGCLRKLLCGSLFLTSCVLTSDLNNTKNSTSGGDNLSQKAPCGDQFT